MLIQANTPMGHIATIDITQIEALWEQVYDDKDANSFFCVGVSGTVYNLTESNYKKLMEHWKANGQLL